MKELKKNKSPGLITQYFYFKIDRSLTYDIEKNDSLQTTLETSKNLIDIIHLSMIWFQKLTFFLLLSV